MTTEVQADRVLKGFEFLLRKPRLISSLLLFVVTLTISSSFVLKNRQLHMMGGMAEEYFDLGWNLHDTGRFHSDEKIAYVFRPPGYPFFIASVLKLWGQMPPKSTVIKNRTKLEQILPDAFKTICLAQTFLLSLSTVFLFLWLLSFCRLRNAFILAFLFACNPYMLIQAGLLHYSMLHIFLTLAASYVLACGINQYERKAVLLLISGAIWGLATLTRPMTLILPVFVLLISSFHFRFSPKPVIKTTVLFTLGMMLAISPYTMRNYVLTDRIIPVNAQGGIALWSGTVIKMPRNPNHFRWWSLIENDLVQKQQYEIRHKIFGAEPPEEVDQHFRLFLANTVQINDAYQIKALENFREQPEVYLYNAAQNFLTFNLEINSIFIKVFQAIQQPTKNFQLEWLRVGNPQNFYSSTAANAYSLFIKALTVLSIVGFGLALKHKEKFLLAPGFVYMCFMLAHSLTYMDLMYYYIKIPFLFLFAGYTTELMNRHIFHFAVLNCKISAATIINLLLTGFGIGLTVMVWGNA